MQVEEIKKEISQEAQQVRVIKEPLSPVALPEIILKSEIGNKIIPAQAPQPEQIIPKLSPREVPKDGESSKQDFTQEDLM